MIKQILPTLLFLLICFTFFLFSNTPPIKPVNAQNCAASNLNQGLISALSVTGGGVIGNLDQTCVLDPQATYRDFKVPSYDELENQFYTQSRSNAKTSNQLNSGNLNFTGNGIYRQSSSLTVSGATGNGVQVIFIRGNLTITNNITYADTDQYSGLVFIASGNIDIYSTVTQVNAVLISFGRICTAFESDSCLNGTVITPQLVVNGSLISLNRTNLPSGDSAISLARNLAINDEPAEVINKQAKYLYILKSGLLTSDLILIEEDKNYEIPPDPGGTPIPAPPVATCQGTNPLAISSNPDFKDILNCVLGI